jgi:CHASE2 domain-containing sensor protein
MLDWVLSHPRIRSIAVGTALALVAFWTDPLGIGEQQTRALDNYIAVATQYLRAGPPKNLAVLLIDQDALKEWSVDWPIPYSKMAELVHELACAHTQGVFFDFTASRQFNPAEGDKDLRDAVEDSSQGAVCVDGERPEKIPVFLGKIEQVVTPLNTWLDDRNKLFLLNAGEDDGIYQSGKEEFPARAVPIKEASPAFGLMRVMPFGGARSESEDVAPCRDDDPRPQCWRAPLTLVWNGGLDPAQGKVSNTLACRGDKGLVDILWGQTPWGASDLYETCPPVLTLRALDLERDLGYIEAHGDPTIPLTGRFVLVGVDLPGLNDKVLTPVHDHLPGVYKHAVALGALIHYRAHYPTLPSPTSLGVLVVAIYLALESAREFLRGRQGQSWLFAAVFVVFGGAFALLVYLRNWPASLVVSVFGYYAAVAVALFVAWHAKTQAKAHVASVSAAVAAGKGQQP